MPESLPFEAPLARLLAVTRDILEAEDLDHGLRSIGTAVRDLFRFKYVRNVAAEDSTAPMQRRVMLGWTEEMTRERIGERVGRDERQHHIRPEELMLEISEHAILRSSSYADAALVGLRNLGVRRCIDDFGTGYSSLRYLQEFPIDALKIDRSFIQGPQEGLGSEPIVKLLTQLAASYHVEVIAEGVEYERQSTALAKIGCGLGQGYLFAPPLSAESFGEALLERGNAGTMPPAPVRARSRTAPRR